MSDTKWYSLIIFTTYESVFMMKSSKVSNSDVLSPLQLIIVTPGAQRALPEDTKCPPAVQRMQAKLASTLENEN